MFRSEVPRPVLFFLVILDPINSLDMDSELLLALNTRQTLPPFTDWQNDLHLISGFDHWFLYRPLLDLATLITAATR